MQAVCFNCGSLKKQPLNACASCHTAPESREQQIASIAMSTECITPDQLSKCVTNIRKKKRLPKFGEKLLARAEERLEEHFVVNQRDDDDSMQFSSSMFELSSLQETPKERFQFGDTLDAYIVGRRKNVTDEMPPPSAGTNLKTYHKTEWKIGVDLTKAEAIEQADDAGRVYVLYRWLTDRWIRKFINETSFMQLKAMEDGQGKF